MDNYVLFMRGVFTVGLVIWSRQTGIQSELACCGMPHIYIYSVILFWGQTIVNDGKRLASVQIYAKLNRLLNFVLLEKLSVE